MYTVIPSKQMHVKNAVFVAVICDDVQPYRNYDGVPLDMRDAVIPRVLMLLRWDNLFGFPGGFVDDDESLRQAAVREVWEEIGHEINEEQLHPICSHVDEHEFATHLYSIVVNFIEFQQMCKKAPGAVHYIAETLGVVTPSITECVENMRKQNFAHNAGQQFDALIEWFNQR